MLVSPRIRLFFVSNATTLEGEKYIKFEKLVLQNGKVPFLGLPWTVIHCIDKTSPLYGFSLEELRQKEAEVIVILDAVDCSTSGAFESRYYYTTDDFVLDGKFEDMITRESDGQLQVEYNKFHDLQDDDISV